MGDLFEDEPDTTRSTGTGLMGGGFPAVIQEAAVVVKAPVGTTLESIPLPRRPAGDGELSDEEQQTFDACRAGIDNLHNAFWVAGKALETMKTGNLHRNSGTPNFADYVWDNWEISESHAQRLMSEWRIGEALAGMGWRPRESQVRELTPVAKVSGAAAAVAVYDTLARAGSRVTSRALKEVVQQLPTIPSDSPPADVIGAVRKILELPAADLVNDTAASESSGAPEHPSPGPSNLTQEQGNGRKPDPTDSDDVRRLMQTLAHVTDAAKAISRPAVTRAIKDHPEAAMLVVSEIETTLGKIDRAIAVRKTLR